MANIIELFNPTDKPFGRLSNNAYHPMTIDGKKYDTVTNFIYSNMLTAPSLRTTVQNAKIRGYRGVNQELMTAIDFLIQPVSSEPRISRVINPQKNYGKVHKMRYLSKVTGKPFSEFQKMGDKKVDKKYKKYFERHGKAELSEEDIQKSWIEYAKTGNLAEQEKELQKRRDFQLLISNEVRKPFYSVNLVDLKKQLIAESTRNQMGIYQIYNQSLQQEIFNIISDATHKGYEVRFQDPKLQTILLRTGNFPIQYESQDPFLGIGADGNGANLVGKILMQLRHNIRVRSSEAARESDLESKYKKIYDTYLAYVILRREISDNKKQLAEYIGMTPEQIISKFGSKNITFGVPTQETVIQLYKQDQLPQVVMNEIYSPGGTLSMNMRKMMLGQLRNQLLRDKEDIIFNSYLEYMLKGYDDEIDTEVERQFAKHVKTGMRKVSKPKLRLRIMEDIIARQKAELPKDKLSKLKSRVIDLFKLGMLSASLSDRIDAEIELLQIPSEEEINEAEIAEVVPAQFPVDKAPEDISSAASSGSSDGSPVTKMMKQIFRDDKMKRKDMIDMIVSIKGGHRADYNDWSVTDLKNRLEELETEKRGGKSIEEADVDVDNDAIYVQPSGQPIGIFRDEEQNPPELVPFNPESYTGMLMIDNMYFPTIQHYIIAKLIANTGTKRAVDSYGSISFKKGMGITDAQKRILVDPNGGTDQPGDFFTIPLASEIYDKEEKETNTMLLSIYTATSLNKKFEDKGLQDLLLLTGDSQIIWDSPQNFYLGAGNEETPGNNYVGVTMMDIREKLTETRTVEEDVTIDEEHLIKFVQKDQFIMAWVEMRVKDMCGVVYKLQQYLKFKDGIVIDINEEKMMVKLINYVLDTVYQPCKSLVLLSKDVDIKVPSFFVHMVNKCKGMASGEAPTTITDNKGNSRYSKEIEAKRSENDREVGRLETEFWGGNRIKHTISESREFEEHQRNEWAKFWSDLNQSDASQNDKNESLVDFKKVQKEEYNIFWGIETGKKTRDEISRHEHRMTELRKEFKDYLRKVHGVEKHYHNISVDIAQIYWNRIAVMLTALILNVNPSTDANIRDVLVKAEMLNSEKSNCVRIIANEQDNCIVSAIMNLLTGIVEFKNEFQVDSDDMKLDEDDVRLAGSIILNNKFTPSIVNEDVNSDEEEDVSANVEEVDEPFDVSPAGSFPSDRDDGDEPEYGENPYFAFDKKGKKLGGKGGKQIGSSGDLAKVEQQVILISPTNSKEIATEIMKTVQTVKNSNISSKVKQNRVNFFATIR